MMKTVGFDVKCSVCGKEVSFFKMKGYPGKWMCPDCLESWKKEMRKKRTHVLLTDEEHNAAMDELGLLEGEEKKLEYSCYRQSIGPISLWDGQRAIEQRKGLLVFTNDNMIFMEQQGSWSSTYMQALRVPLEQITGISSGGLLIKNLRILTVTSEHHFANFELNLDFNSVVAEMQKHLKEVREERKRITKDARLIGGMNTTVFCRHCGTRNKFDESFCANCGAPLT